MGASRFSWVADMVQAPQSPRAKTLLTLEAFLALPETKPGSEFIDGLKIGRAFSELRCTFGGRSVIPDVSVFVWDRIVRDPSGEVANVFGITPDWTIEILSPDQSQTKVVKNIVHCLKHGALMGWLIDPDDRTVFVYEPDREIVIFDQPDDRLPMPEFAQGLVLTVGELFGWLVD
jgi:Uma2 family endonuclease